MHTKADPLVLAQNETVFAEEVAANPKATADLVQRSRSPPSHLPRATWGARTAPGHCNFTAAVAVAVIDLMENWVRNGVYPGRGRDRGGDGRPRAATTRVYRPGPWPAGRRRRMT